jgi:hypothetical protein
LEGKTSLCNFNYRLGKDRQKGMGRINRADSTKRLLDHVGVFGAYPRMMLLGNIKEF